VEVGYLDLVGEGYMGSMQWQLGREMGTIPAFASRTQENQENLEKPRKPGKNQENLGKPRKPGKTKKTYN